METSFLKACCKPIEVARIVLVQTFEDELAVLENRLLLANMLSIRSIMADSMYKVYESINADRPELVNRINKLKELIRELDREINECAEGKR